MCWRISGSRSPEPLTIGRRPGVLGARPKNPVDELAAMLESGAIKPLIDRCVPPRETADALRYLGEGSTQGKVVMQVRAPS